jgi:hypothetical protein
MDCVPADLSGSINRLQADCGQQIAALYPDVWHHPFKGALRAGQVIGDCGCARFGCQQNALQGDSKIVLRIPS